MKKKIFIVAGEASGDYLAAKFIERLDQNLFEIQGVGGPLMAAAGGKLVEDYHLLAIMGLTEVIARLIPILLFLKKITKIIKEFQPDLLITIDSPGFNFRLVKNLKGQFKSLHYVAPSVWAYKAERVKIVQELYQAILLLFPFEVPYFASMPSFLVGPPLLEEKNLISELTLEERLAKEEDSEDIKITLMPGSRKMEIKKHLPILLKTAEKLLDIYPENLSFYLLTLPELEDFLQILLKNSSIKDKIHLVSDRLAKQKIREASSLAWVKSGTGTLDCLGATLPAITFYKLSPITYFFIKRKVKISNVNLVNIINNNNLLPELIQDDFTVEKLYKKTLDLLDKKSKESIIVAYYEAYKKIYQGEKPSYKATEIIKTLCE